jgi:hypothetical protein
VPVVIQMQLCEVRLFVVYHPAIVLVVSDTKRHSLLRDEEPGLKTPIELPTNAATNAKETGSW